MVNETFWESENSARYREFSTIIPSDIPAYEVAYYLLGLQDKVVLDFGCFEGKSSVNLLRKGASRVVGVDNVASRITTAQRNYECIKNVSFAYVDEKSPLPNAEEFDAVCMTFVHPTIASVKVLAYQLQKIYGAIKENGDLVMLGLHPESFNHKEFLFYGHKLPHEKEYEDALPFENELRLPNGETVGFTDYCWTTNTLSETLKNAGFLVEGIYSLREDLDEKVGDVLRESIKTIGNSTTQWKDEWKAPLYQVVYAKKGR